MTKSPSPSALPDLVKLAKVAMDKAMENTRREFAAIRTGKATTQLLDLVKVDAYGNLLPLNQVASVAAPEPRLLTVTVWDKGLAHAVEKAIRDSDLGLNPAAMGDTIRVPMPPLTEDRRKELIKVVKHEAENARVAVRNLRRDANHTLKEALKKKEVSENDEHRAQEEVQKLTDRHIAEIEKLLQQKESELLAV